ncbi:MAG: nucleotidyltransferase [Saprospirales bacterium]|nr:MAG: nucleotidyltransferase [Saprospirales bacterium]
MRLIIPMAGRGSRLRPHTLTTPKPLVPIAGKPIVQWLIEILSEGLEKPFDEISFVVGDLNDEVKQQLLDIAENNGSKGSIYYQDEPLGPAHAIFCAKASIKGQCIVAFADTLFISDFSFDPKKEGIIWTQRVEDPSGFGVVKTNEKGIITQFVEKSPVFVSDQAIVGIYYFRDGERFADKLDYLIKNDIRDKGEFQITSVLDLMKEDGVRFSTAKIDEWLDCGNKEAIISTTERILATKPGSDVIESDAILIDSKIIHPCFIGKGAVIKNSVVGPFVTVGQGSIIIKSVVEKSVIQNDARIKNVNLKNSMIGNHAEYKEKARKISLGDYSRFD